MRLDFGLIVEHKQKNIEMLCRRQDLSGKYKKNRYNKSVFFALDSKYRLAHESSVNFLAPTPNRYVMLRKKEQWNDNTQANELEIICVNVAIDNLPFLLSLILHFLARINQKLYQFLHIKKLHATWKASVETIISANSPCLTAHSAICSLLEHKG